MGIILKPKPEFLEVASNDHLHISSIEYVSTKSTISIIMEYHLSVFENQQFHTIQAGIIGAILTNKHIDVPSLNRICNILKIHKQISHFSMRKTNKQNILEIEITLI